MKIQVGADVYEVSGNEVTFDLDGEIKTELMPFAPDSADEFMSWGHRNGWFTEQDVDSAELIGG